ncbi:YhgE/Pip domain-containing protein [Arthrobacter sp. zg-Y1171]|uniref:YhgE/Pip domain-containing protein n=1 Tax=Arthrobacter sp. zg-Y1171 TaxID=2964610 RepID=UPI002104D4EB|nr:YhgE/Pip domain-containing protein [Arthrobacter sp. zg-Y1171]MCQ1996598.1 YhgE/Pip domain-containing protein [Arthrobacter sp. zg-Y1171]UWX82197.1 YhgE/Pip domain-containing protein [Arthrobacter sp. zg-Y1171]
MTAFRLALSELRRMTSGTLPKLAILALSLVPLLYGAVYLYANWDPYGNLDGVKAALVVDDDGADTADGRLDVGATVRENLLEDGTFDWEMVDSPAAAERGVKDGTYEFALTIPGDFSANLASASDPATARKATLHVTTNEANNYLLSSIVDKLTSSVHDTVAAEVGEETASQLLTGFSTVHGQLERAADGAGQLAGGAATADSGAAELVTGLGTLSSGAQALVSGQEQLVAGANQLSTGAGELSAGANQLSSGAAELSSGLGQLSSATAQLPQQTQQLADGARQVAAGTAGVEAAVTASADTARQGVTDAVTRLVQRGVLTPEQAAALQQELAGTTAGTGGLEQLKALSDGAAAVSAGADQLAGSAPQLASGISTANDGASRLSAGAADLSTGAAELSSGAGGLAGGEQQALDGTRELAAGVDAAAAGAGSLQDGLGQLRDGSDDLARQLKDGAGEIPNPNDEERANGSAVIADPLTVSTVDQAEAGSYGAGLAPYFLTLAMWVGIFMLAQALRPISRRALASNAPGWKIALGGWLPFLGVSLVQATLLYAVVRFGLGLDPVHPVQAWGLLLMASMAFSALIQGIVALLGSVGKFVVLVLLVLQLVSSGGTFPWQTIPAPLHLAHDVLPMGYTVTGLRQLLYGGDLTQVTGVAVGLLAYTAVGLLLSLLAARRHRLWTLKTLQPEISI